METLSGFASVLAEDAVVTYVRAAGAIYADDSDISIGGNTSFGHNSAKGELRRGRGAEYPRY